MLQTCYIRQQPDFSNLITIPYLKFGGTKEMKRASIHLMLLATLLFTLCSVMVMAQETTATINGRVTDPTGAVVTNAEISLINTQTKE